MCPTAYPVWLTSAHAYMQAKSQRAENAKIETVVELVVAAYEEKHIQFTDESEKVGEVDGRIAAVMQDLEERLSGADANIMTTDDAIKSDEEIAAMTEEDSEKLVKKCAPVHTFCPVLWTCTVEHDVAVASHPFLHGIDVIVRGMYVSGP